MRIEVNEKINHIVDLDLDIREIQAMSTKKCGEFTIKTRSAEYVLGNLNNSFVVKYDGLRYVISDMSDLDRVLEQCLG